MALVDARRDDRPDRPPDAVLGSPVGADAPLQTPLHRLVDDDAVVHQHPDPHGQAEKGDEVERPPSDNRASPPPPAGSPAPRPPTTATARISLERRGKAPAARRRSPSDASFLSRSSCSLTVSAASNPITKSIP